MRFFLRSRLFPPCYTSKQLSLELTFTLDCFDTGNGFLNVTNFHRIFTLTGCHLKTQIEDAIEEYMLSLRKTWVDTTSIIVRRAAIENAIYNIDGITDVTNVLINGGTENITLQENVIPMSCS